MNVVKKIYNHFLRINNKSVYLQRPIIGFRLDETKIKELYNLDVKHIDYDNDSDLENWCNVINNSYDDCYFDLLKARTFLKEHETFQNGHTALFYDGIKCCATVSWGGYLNKPKVGGDYRIGVINEYKRRGIGRMCVEYAYSQLSNEGFRLGESLIMVKRIPSLNLHFSLGFIPRYDTRYVTYNLEIKNTSFTQRILLTLRLHHVYHSYLRQLKNSYK